MNDLDTSTIAGDEASEPVHPESLLQEFRERNVALDTRLDALLEMVQQIQSQIRDESQGSLERLAKAAKDMANGRVYQQIDIQAKGELGALAASLNQTLANLQQLDASVQHQSTQVPELAAQLDAITADTETATQSVMNRLDVLMNTGAEAEKSLGQAIQTLTANQEVQVRFQTQIDGFLDRASGGEDPTRIAQEVLDFLFEQRLTSRLLPIDMSKTRADMQVILDESFEILNTLQFQDITRQKVEKVVLLLKQFQSGLQRLLSIFKIEGASQGNVEVFEHRAVATQDHIFDTTLEADTKKESVEDIIAAFKKTKG
jgi:chemotaxis regulatin CheY-phosphate phosphatase CheZ